MKYLLLTLLVLTLAAAPVSSQTRKKNGKKAKTKIPVATPAVPVYEDDEPPPMLPLKVLNNQKPGSDNLVEQLIGEASLLSVSIPDDLTDVSGSTESKTNKNVSWTSFARYWKQPTVYNRSALEVSVNVTTWNNDIKEIIPDLRPDLATPEHLVLLDLLGDLNQKNKPDSFVKEAKALEVDRLNGAYFYAEFPSDRNRFTTGWQTHRYYQGKLQRISISVTGNRNESAKARKIIESLKIKQAE